MADYAGIVADLLQTLQPVASPTRPGRRRAFNGELAVELATPPHLWNDPAMTVTADSQSRVVMPGARPGDVFACEDEGNGHFLLGRSAVTLRGPSEPIREVGTGRQPGCRSCV